DEEKRHLREMRALKQQYREAQRKRGLLAALRGLTAPEAEATHEEMLDRLTRQNVEAEARFEVAADEAGLSEEAAARRAQEEADREAVRKAEAEALVRMMKQQMGDPAVDDPDSETARAEGRTIGRVTPPEEGERPPEGPRGSNTIGRAHEGE